ncbi:MAG: hypothetical protein GX434_16880 [Peptococcaceae bacterium]|nr:hypothetical protein [Peptococcaceae bacterium]
MSSQTALMISVVSGKETLAALEGGADIIDVKNPAEGALGAPTPAAVQDVCLRLKGSKPFSIALGEFPGKPCAAALAALGSAFFRPDFVKIAFIPHHSPEEICKTLQEIKKSLSIIDFKRISLVSVAYADTLSFASWKLERFAEASREGGADGCLVDTWEKKNKTLLDYLPLDAIQKWIGECHRQELFCGLAGSLSFADVASISRFEPDIIGVRSAVCGGDRLGGTVSAPKVKALKEIIDRRKHETEYRSPDRYLPARGRQAFQDLGH